MIFLVVMVIHLCQDWIYDAKADREPLTPEQKKFELWLATEAGIIVSCIFGGILYSFTFKLQHPCLTFRSPLLNGESFGDFMQSNTLAIDMTNNVLTPAVIGIVTSVKRLN